MAKVTNWNKFTLLLWKNWTLKWHRKWELAIELLLPAIFASLLVILRTSLVPKPNAAETKYPPVNIANLDLYINSLGVESLLKPPRSKFLYSPNTSADFDRIIEAASSSLSIIEYQGYANAEDLEYALKTDSYLVGVQFNNVQDYPKKLSYDLRFPSALRTSIIPETWLTSRLFPKVITNRPRNPDENDGGIPVGYLREGFIPIQHAISMAYIKLASNQESIPTIEMQRYPYPAYVYDLLMDLLTEYLGQIILMSFLYSCIVITKNISSEKDKQLKEVMKMMGLQSWIHWFAWFVQSFFMLAISSMLIMIILKITWSNDRAVFTYIDCMCLLFFLLVYNITIICFCFMIACFFSKASTAAAVTGLIMVCTFLPYELMQQFYDTMSLAQKLGWCLAFNTAMPLGFDVIIGFERTGQGLHWGNMFSPVSVDDSLTLGAIILVMLASCVPFILICLYIEQIYPGEFGVARKWNFPFTAQFWRCNTKYKGVEDIPNVEVKPHNHDAFEVEPTGKRVYVQIKSLEKKFDDKIAVQGLSLNMYENEITVLLGHNGAGKTTTLSMLAGMFPPTSGTAIIDGSDIRTNLEAARMSLGFCPEHNVLFDDLSVSNHITFFSCVKGLKGEALQKEVDTYLKMIKLENKANVAASKLSGGMKRKLSLCCALCGDTKVVLCDEPSSGMDPSSRRQLWDLFQSKKVGRTVLITTHYMDEADVLGDRIAIMFKGELKCHGSSFFLKKKYGSGYNLNCVKLEGCNANEVSALLGDFIPGIKPKSDIGAELSYELPDKYSSVFEKMFRSLEKNSERLRLNGYGISITSLEEVFMKVGAESANDATHKEQSTKINGNSKLPEEDLESIQFKRTFSGNSRLLKGTDLFFNQWHAMFLKKFLYTFHNKILFLMQNMFPVAFVILIISISRFEEDKELPPMTMKLTQYPDVVTVLERHASLSNLARDAIEVKIADYYKEIANADADHTFKSTGSSSFTDYILDLGKTLQARIDSSYLAAATVAEGKITAWLNNQPLHTAPLSINLVHNAMAKALIDPDAEITITNAPLPYSTESILNKLSVGAIGLRVGSVLTYAMSFVTAFYVLILIKERESRWNLMQFVGGAKVWIFWLTQFFWDMATFAITALAVIITIACFQPKCFTEFAQLARHFLILILFGFSILPIIYLFSFFFTQPGTGFACVSIATLFLGNGMQILLSVLAVEGIGDDLPWYFRVFPLFSLKTAWHNLFINTATNEACDNSLTAMGSKELLCEITPKCCNPTPYFDWKEPGILPEIVYFITTGIIFFLIVIIIDYGLIKKMTNKLWRLKK